MAISTCKFLMVQSLPNFNDKSCDSNVQDRLWCWIWLDFEAGKSVWSKFYKLLLDLTFIFMMHYVTLAPNRLGCWIEAIIFQMLVQIQNFGTDFWAGALWWIFASELFWSPVVCLFVHPSVNISHNWVFQIQGKNPVTEIVQMADSCQKGTLIVWITTSFYTLVFKIESCSFADQLYIYQRCAYYLDFDFW